MITPRDLMSLSWECEGIAGIPYVMRAGAFSSHLRQFYGNFSMRPRNGEKPRDRQARLTFSLLVTKKRKGDRR